MKRFQLFLIIILLGAFLPSATLLAQQSGLAWLKAIGSTGRDYSPGFAVSETGKLFLPVLFNQQLVLPGTTDTILSKGGYDMVLMRMTSNGSLENYWHFGNNGVVNVTDISIRNEYVYISGSHQDTLFLFGTGQANNSMVSVSQNNLSGFILKLSLDGDVIEFTGFPTEAIWSVVNNIDFDDEAMIASGQYIADTVSQRKNYLYLKDSDAFISLDEIERLTINESQWYRGKTLISGSYSDTLQLAGQTIDQPASKSGYIALLDSNTAQFISFDSYVEAAVSATVVMDSIVFAAIDFQDSLFVNDSFIAASMGSSDVLVVKMDTSLTIIDKVQLGGVLNERANKLLLSNGVVNLFANVCSPRTILTKAHQIQDSLSLHNIKGNACLIEIDTSFNADFKWVTNQDWSNRINGLYRINNTENILSGIFADSMLIDSTPYYTIGNQDVFLMRISDICLGRLKQSNLEIAFCEGDSVFIQGYSLRGKNELIKAAKPESGVYISKPMTLWYGIREKSCGCLLADTIAFVFSDKNIAPEYKTTISSYSLLDGSELMTVKWCGSCRSNNNLFTYQVIPNPFINQTQLALVLPEQGKLKLEILDYTGTTIYVINERPYTSGAHSIHLPLAGYSKGSYLLRITYSINDRQHTEIVKLIKN